MIVLILQKECRRRLRSDVIFHFGVQRDAVPGQGEVPGVERNGEIRARDFPGPPRPPGHRGDFRSACSPPPPDSRRLKTRSLRPCEDRCAILRRERAPASVFSGRPPTTVSIATGCADGNRIARRKGRLGTRYFNRTQVTPSGCQPIANLVCLRDRLPAPGSRRPESRRPRHRYSSPVERRPSSWVE